MDESHDYRVDISSTSSDTAFIGSPDGLSTLGVGPPPQFGGKPGVWSPEHLYVASVASCLMTTFRAIAAMSGVEVLEYTDSAAGTLIREENRLYRMSQVILHPRVVVSDPRQVDLALRLLDKAEKVCLISRSISAEVQLEPEVTAPALV